LNGLNKNPNVSEIASLAKAVDRAASKGDGIARTLLLIQQWN